MKVMADSGDLSKKTKKAKKVPTMDTTPDSAIPTPSQPIPVPANVPVQAMPKEFMDHLNRKLLESLGKEIRNPHPKKPESGRITELKDLKVLESVVSEFLQTFIVIGYTFKGEKVTIGHATSQQENDALTEHLRKMFMRVMNRDE